MLKQKRPNGICKGFSFSENQYEASLTTASLVQITDSLESSAQLKHTSQQDLSPKTNQVSATLYVEDQENKRDQLSSHGTFINNQNVKEQDPSSNDDSMIIDSSYEDGDDKRISSSSRVNFSKLSKKEQTIRFKNMQKKIQRLQIQVRSLKINNTQLRKKIKTSKRSLCIQNKSLFKIVREGNLCNNTKNLDDNNDQNQIQRKNEGNFTSQNQLQKFDSDQIIPTNRSDDTQNFQYARGVPLQQQFQSADSYYQQTLGQQALLNQYILQNQLCQNFGLQVQSPFLPLLQAPKIQPLGTIIPQIPNQNGLRYIQGNYQMQ